MQLTRPPIKRLATSIVLPVIALVLAGAVTHIQLSKFEQLTIKDTSTRTKEELLREEAQTKASVALLKQLPTLGFDNLIADWAFLGFIQYFGDQKARKQTGFSVTPDFFEVIVDRDPHFMTVYSHLSSGITLFAGQPKRSIALISKGLESMTPQTHPEAYYLWRAIGTDQLLFLGDSQAAQQSFATAADWASQSSDPRAPVSAQRARATAQFLAKNSNSKQAQVSAWLNILGNAHDSQTHQLVIQNIKALGGEVTITPNGQVRAKMPQED